MLAQVSESHIQCSQSLSLETTTGQLSVSWEQVQPLPPAVPATLTAPRLTVRTSGTFISPRHMMVALTGSRLTPRRTILFRQAPFACKGQPALADAIYSTLMISVSIAKDAACSVMPTAA